MTEAFAGAIGRNLDDFFQDSYVFVDFLATTSTPVFRRPLILNKNNQMKTVCLMAYCFFDLAIETIAQPFRFIEDSF